MREEFNVCLVLIMPAALYGLLSSLFWHKEVCFRVLIARQMGNAFLGKVVGTPLCMTFGLGLFLTFILCIHCWFRADCQQLIEQQSNCFAFILYLPSEVLKVFPNIS